MFLILSLIAGILCGAVPVIIGALKDELELGMFGFIASVVSAAISGLYLAVPMSALFLFLISRRIYMRSSKTVLAQVIPFAPRSKSEV
ncbi:MAG: hypothetical protein ACE3JP_08655 [Ectobacillus sp.]